ncbi:hypothetical protein ANTPLA_LOCUS5724 [Anthophora plagiata]
MASDVTKEWRRNEEEKKIVEVTLQAEMKQINVSAIRIFLSYSYPTEQIVKKKKKQSFSALSYQREKKQKEDSLQISTEIFRSC